METRTDFFKDATIERVRNRIIMVHMDLCKMVQKRNEYEDDAQCVEEE